MSKLYSNETLIAVATLAFERGASGMDRDAFVRWLIGDLDARALPQDSDRRTRVPRKDSVDGRGGEGHT